MAPAGHELLMFVAATEIGLIDNPLGLLCDVAAALQESLRQGAPYTHKWQLVASLA